MIPAFISKKKNRIGNEDIALPSSSPLASPAEQSSKATTTPQVLRECQFHKNEFKELGAIRYKYNDTTFYNAVEESRESSKPILMVFQEFPGNSVCVTFGRDVLSHPLLVEAAESLFVTVVINSKSFERLNGPVVRIVGERGDDIVSPVADGNWTVGHVSWAMIKALHRKNLPIPRYLELLVEEYGSMVSSATREVVFAMHSSRVGEAAFAFVDGVLAAEPGFVGRQHVVKVTFDTTRTSYREMVEYALRNNVATIIYHSTEKQEEIARIELQKVGAITTTILKHLKSHHTVILDQNSKHYLRRTALRHVPMTTLQALRINGLLHDGADQEEVFAVLSLRQLAILLTVATRKPKKEAVNVDIKIAWKCLSNTGFFTGKKRRRLSLTQFL